MNIISLVFGITVFSVIKFMMIGGTLVASPPEFGTLTASYEFQEIPECNEIILCLNVVGVALANAFLALAFIVQLLLNITIYISLLVVFLGSVLIDTIPGAPWYVNVIMLTPLTLIVALIIFKLVVKGEVDEE